MAVIVLISSLSRRSGREHRCRASATCGCGRRARLSVGWAGRLDLLHQPLGDRHPTAGGVVRHGVPGRGGDRAEHVSASRRRPDQPLRHETVAGLRNQQSGRRRTDPRPVPLRRHPPAIGVRRSRSRRLLAFSAGSARATNAASSMPALTHGGWDIIESSPLATKARPLVLRWIASHQ
jgi:hypothetical protein